MYFFLEFSNDFFSKISGLNLISTTDKEKNINTIEKRSVRLPLYNNSGIIREKYSESIVRTIR